jgi:hypothetical protein
MSADMNPFISTEAISACFDEGAGAQKGDSTWLNISMSATEEEFSTKATSLVFRLLLAMDAKPQLIERGKYTGKKLRSAHQPEIWTPNVIGGKYVIHRSTSAGQGGGWTLRLHWRRGHFRQQAHGPQSKLRKTVWIEPYVAGIE